MREQISMAELYNRLSQLGKNEIILDVRGRDEFVDAHVPGSKNIPHTEVEKHVNELKSFARIYIHCRSGGRAQMAYQTLEKLGLKNLVCVADSGMKDWLEAGFQIEK